MNTFDYYASYYDNCQYIKILTLQIIFKLVTDANTATGASPEQIADQIRQAILSEEKDVILAPLLPIAVQWLRLLCPSMYFWVMERRARRMNNSG